MTLNDDDNESTMTVGQMTEPNTLGGGDDDDFEDGASDGGLRSTADNNLIIMLNGEMVFGKKEGDRPRPRPNVLRGGVVPRRPMVTSPAMVSPAGIREANSSMRAHPDSERFSVTDSNIFDQSTLDEDDLSYNHRPISPIGDASVGSMQQIAREIDLMMEGSYFSTREQPLLPHETPAPGASVLSARGMARIQDVSSDDDEDDDDYAIAQYPLSTPYRSIQLKDDWVKAWGQAWGLKVNKAEEQKRCNRLNALQAKRDQSRYTAGALNIPKASSLSASPYVKRRDCPSVTAVMDQSISKAASEVAGSPPPPGPKSPAKSPWADRTMEWAASERPTRTPAKAAAVEQSLASAEKTVKKSKWVFGDEELSEDEEDEKLGEDNIDGEEAWTRSAKKQNRTFEPYRKMIVIDVNAEEIEKASASAQRKHTNPYSIRKHVMSSREQQVQSDEDNGPVHKQESIFKYTPDVAKLRLNREKLRRGEYEDDEDYRPLFRRNDGRLVRKLNPIGTSLSDSVAPPTIVNLGPHDRVGAWV
jgi:hypothetical protein